MKKKLKLKGYVLPVLYVTLFTGAFFVTLAASTSFKNKITGNNINDDSQKESVKEVIKEDDTTGNNSGNMIAPYTDSSVTVGRDYYDYKGNIESQKNSIVYYNDTYMQNSGIDYVSSNAFDVLNVLPGTVLEVKDDENLGKTVSIKHDNNLVSNYESLSEVSVKKGDVIDKGIVIGKSGTNKIDSALGNHLHFELYDGGSLVDPKLYIGKDVNISKGE